MDSQTPTKIAETLRGWFRPAVDGDPLSLKVEFKKKSLANEAREALLNFSDSDRLSTDIDLLLIDLLLIG